ncbi:MAG TPA: hypothetical protein VF789_19655 [Thermoanaerobaculia bacterium]
MAALPLEDHALKKRAAWLAVLALGGPLTGAGNAASWPVHAPGARPGEVVRLPIPDRVNAEYEGYYGDLHVEAGGRDIPYQVDRSDPFLAVRLSGVRPRPSHQAGFSRIELPLRPGLPFDSVRLRARPEVFSRKVQLVDGDSVVVESDWTCFPGRPCALEFEVSSKVLAKNARPLLQFLDGENPPLPAVDVEVWRRRESLAFLWPRSGPVRLLTGKDRPATETPEDLKDFTLPAGPERAARIAAPVSEERSAAPAFLLSGGLLLALLGWKVSQRRRVSPALILALGLSAAGAARAEEGRLYSRPVEVPAAGWVRVPLDLETLRRLGAHGTGVRVFAPGGEEVASQLQPFSGETGIDLWPIPQEGDTKAVAVDLGEDLDRPPSVLLLGASNPDVRLSGVVRLDASSDTRTWKPLSEEALFEVREPVYRKGLLTYPPGRYRFLRLTVADPYGNVHVRRFISPSSRVLSVAVDRPECASEGPVTTCLLRLPARHLRPVRLELMLAHGEKVGLAAYQAQAGAWTPLAEGVGPAGSRQSIPFVLEEPLDSRTLRVEVRGAAGPPRVLRAVVEMAQPVVVFRAATPGRFEIRYGDGRWWRGEDDLPSEADEAAWIPPGPESAKTLEPLPRFATRPSVPLAGRIGAAWPVHAPGARPGDVVRLEVPPHVYAASGDLRLRLAAGDRQLPYIGHAADEPALVLERRGLRPAGVGHIDIPLPRRGLPLSTYRMTFARGTGRSWVDLSARGEGMTAAGDVICPSRPLLPCRLEGRLRRSEKGSLFDSQLRINSHWPLDLTLWRRREALVFVWPEHGPVRLVAGGGENRPQYDLRLLESEVLARPWHAASLGPKEPEISVLRLLAFLAAGCAALVLLFRVLPRS